MSMLIRESWFFFWLDNYILMFTATVGVCKMWLFMFCSEVNQSSGRGFRKIYDEEINLLFHNLQIFVVLNLTIGQSLVNFET